MGYADEQAKYEKDALRVPIFARPPVLVPVIDLPLGRWESLPRRFGTRTIAWIAWLIFAVALGSGTILGQFQGLEDAARSSGELMPALVSEWFPMSLYVALLLGWMPGRRSAWVYASLSALTAMALQSSGAPLPSLWWGATGILLTWALVTTMPSLRQLLALSALASRARRDGNTPRVPLRYEEITKSTEAGYQKSMVPLGMLGVFAMVTVISALSYAGLKDHPGGGLAALKALGARDPLGIYPLALAGFLPWSVIGILRLLLESSIGKVVWILPAGSTGPVDFDKVKALADGSNTAVGVPLATNEGHPDGAQPFSMMWLGGVGGDLQGALMKWNATRELVMHRFAEKCGKERLRGIRLMR